MTTTKKNYVKPQITVIEVEPQQMICVSGEDTVTFSSKDADDMDTYNGEFY